VFGREAVKLLFSDCGGAASIAGSSIRASWDSESIFQSSHAD
jgi:hypothetical protein